MLKQNRVRELLNYNPQNGYFTWKDNRSSLARKGYRAGAISKTGYRYLTIDNQRYRAHRVAWLYIFGYMPENDIDHKNRKRDDNRIVNLREVSRGCNIRNSVTRCDNTSGIKGVYYNKRDKNWHAYINVGRVKIFIISHKEFGEAVCARLAAEQCLNWSGCDSESPAFKYVRKMLEDRSAHS